MLSVRVTITAVRLCSSILYESLYAVHVLLAFPIYNLYAELAHLFTHSSTARIFAGDSTAMMSVNRVKDRGYLLYAYNPGDKSYRCAA